MYWVIIAYVNVTYMTKYGKMNWNIGFTTCKALKYHSKVETAYLKFYIVSPNEAT